MQKRLALVFSHDAKSQRAVGVVIIYTPKAFVLPHHAGHCGLPKPPDRLLWYHRCIRISHRKARQSPSHPCPHWLPCLKIRSPL